MDNQSEHSAFKDRIKLSEGEDFIFDEKEALAALALYKTNPSPLFVKILSIAGGLMSAALFTLFLAITNVLDSEVPSTIFGVIFILGAVWANRHLVNLLLDTLNISLYTIGYILLTVGMLGMDVDENGVATLIMIVAIGSFYFLRNKVLAFVTVLFFNGSILFMVLHSDSWRSLQAFLMFLLMALYLLYMEEAIFIQSAKKWLKLYRPVCSGFILSFLTALFLLTHTEISGIEPENLWLSSLFNTGLILLVVHRVTTSFGKTRTGRKFFIYIVSFAALLPLILAPGISGCLFLLLITYYNLHKTGFVLATLALLYFIIQYYYELSFTLLEKSAILFVSGIFFLIIFYFVHKTIYRDEKH